MKSARLVSVFKHSPHCFCARFSNSGIRYSVYGRTVLNCRKNYLEKLQDYRPKKLEKSTTFFAFYSMWIDLYKKPLIKENTLKLMQGIFSNHILPYIAKKPLKQVTTQDLQKIINKMHGYPRQATICYQHLNSCFSKAFQLNLIKFNPCTAVMLNRDKGKRGQGLSKQQTALLLQYLETTNHPLKNIIKLYLFTGMRRTELLNITLNDLDFVNNEIHICGTKTKQSKRILQTTPQVLALFPNLEKPFAAVTPDYVDHEFRKICNRIGLPKTIKIHSLRHTFATRCVENNVSMPVLQLWLGHKSIKMTVDTYTHISEEYKRKQIKKLDFLNLDNV